MMKSSPRIDQALNKAKRKCKGIKSGFTKDTKVMHEDISAQIQIKQQPVQIEKKNGHGSKIFDIRQWLFMFW